MANDLDDILLSDDDPDFERFCDEIGNETSKIQTAADFRDELLKRMFEEPEIIGPALRIPKLQDRMRFPGGQVTLYYGFNGHGKSLITSQVLLDMACQGEPGLICSFEMSPMATLHRMVKQSIGTATPSRDWAEAFLRWAQARVWIYNHRGQAATDKLLKLCAYASRKCGVKHVLIDSLMKCVKGEDDYNGQKDFVDACCQLAIAENLHVHLVHHVRKGADEYEIPGKMDAKGTGAILDQVDTGAVIWRNLRLEEKRRNGEEQTDKDYDSVVSITKSRHIEGAEGKVGLYYSVGAQSYTEARGRPLQFKEIASFMPDRAIAL